MSAIFVYFLLLLLLLLLLLKMDFLTSHSHSKFTLRESFKFELTLSSIQVHFSLTFVKFYFVSK